jgi:chromosomal replication initiator protein
VIDGVVNAQDAWHAAHRQLELQLDRANFDTWLRDAVLLRVESNLFVIGVGNDYARDMLQERLYRTVRRAVTDCYGEAVELKFEIKPQPVTASGEPDMPLFRLLAQQIPDSALEQAPTPLHQRVARAPRPELPEYELNPRYTFDRFIAGGENQMIVAAARAVAEHPAGAYNPFFIYGGVGLGKTHLLQAIAHACKGRRLKVIYIPSEIFTNDLVDAIRNRTTAMFRDKYRSADVLLVDDIQFIAGKESTQEEFFHTFNSLYTFNKQVILASDRPPRDLETLEARLRSRFEGGLVMEVAPPELETRIAILRGWGLERGLSLPLTTCELIAMRVKGNVRQLEGVFNQLAAAVQINRLALTPELVVEVLEGGRRARVHVTVEQVLDVTARHHGLTATDLIGPKRTSIINQARQIAMYLARECTTASLPQIGDAFGGRKHSTVLHSCNKVVEDMENDLSVRTIVKDIRDRLAKGD